MVTGTGYSQGRCWGVRVYLAGEGLNLPLATYSPILMYMCSSIGLLALHFWGKFDLQ